MMHQAQMEHRFYTFIQNDVKVIDVAAELSYDLKNYLIRRLNFLPKEERERGCSDGNTGIRFWSHSIGMAA
ncbi:hypothetical protein [Paenibacillus sp. CFBP 13594]|uniref:hypothetical protein n=1 Tax=unclassified Paenibacillus TaxID=185978 RepID=UPI00177F0082|nr:hypothetical protein [Paenibacillus sp. CFBP 13594]MBD8836761.1 hypothetical protein [Paenibacillus sp. CFBP 13594]